MDFELIKQAIAERRLLRFGYDGQERIVEPHLLGQKATGNDVLSAWQVGGFSESKGEPPWRNYLLERMSGVELLDETFKGPRPGFNPEDPSTARIYCRVEPAPSTQDE